MQSQEKDKRKGRHVGVPNNREHSRAIATLDRNSLLAKHTQQAIHDFDLDNVTIIERCPPGEQKTVFRSVAFS